MKKLFCRNASNINTFIFVIFKPALVVVVVLVIVMVEMAVATTTITSTARTEWHSLNCDF